MSLTPEQQAAGAAACTSVCRTCGIVAPNQDKSCAHCLRARNAIAETVLRLRRSYVMRCQACSSFLRSQGSWIRAAPDSAEIMQILLRRVELRAARHGVAIAAAEFVAVPTEPPHSNERQMLRVRLRLRCETTHGVTVEDAHVAEFAVYGRLCDACRSARAAAAGPGHWSAVVQVRQRASHRRTLLHLDQQIARHGAAGSALCVVGSSGELDFYFKSRSHAERLVHFVSSVAPARAVGVSSNNSKAATFSVELCPICRDDLVFLPRAASLALGGLGPLVLCVGVSKSIALLDINSMRLAVMGMAEYDRYRFEPLLSSRRLVEYVVLNMELELEHRVLGPTDTIAWAQVARASDFGKNDTVFSVKARIGWQLEPGDHVLGYDLCSVSSCNNHDLESYGQRHELPDAVLVKKMYTRSTRKMMRRQDGSGRGSASDRGCAEIEELAMAIGCIELNPSDDKELHELLEDLSI